MTMHTFKIDQGKFTLLYNFWHERLYHIRTPTKYFLKHSYLCVALASRKAKCMTRTRTYDRLDYNLLCVELVKERS
jgi:hypothetical protein